MKKSLLLLASVLCICGAIPAQADPIVRTITTTASVVTATTTVVVASAGYDRSLYFLGVQASGTNATDTFQFETSAVASCASANTALTPGTQVAPTTSGNFAATITSGVATAQATSAYALSPVGYMLPAGQNLCMVTAGTTIALYAIAIY